MDAKDFAFDYCGDAEVVKYFGGVFPGVCVAVLPDALIVIAIHCGGLSHLVVSSKQCDV